MKTKLAWKLILAVITAAAITGCTGTGNTTSTVPEETPESEPAENAVSYPTAVNQMHFEAPESFENIVRFSEFKVDGTVIEKDVMFKSDDKDVIGYSYGSDMDISEVLGLDGIEQEEIAGKTVYFYEASGYSLGFVTEGNEVYSVDSEVSMENVKKAFETIRFTDEKDTWEDDTDLGKIKYSFDDSLNLLDTSIKVTEDTEGNLIKKAVNYTFGPDYDNLACIFQFMWFKNVKVEDVLNPERTYTDTEINGIKYSSYGSEGNPPFVYYTQQGDDVYMIQNVGISNGWSTRRSDESYQLLETLLNTVVFE